MISAKSAGRPLLRDPLHVEGSLGDLRGVGRGSTGGIHRHLGAGAIANLLAAALACFVLRPRGGRAVAEQLPGPGSLRPTIPPIISARLGD